VYADEAHNHTTAGRRCICQRALCGQRQCYDPRMRRMCVCVQVKHALQFAGGVSGPARGGGGGASVHLPEGALRPASVL